MFWILPSERGGRGASIEILVMGEKNIGRDGVRVRNVSDHHGLPEILVVAGASVLNCLCDAPPP